MGRKKMATTLLSPSSPEKERCLMEIDHLGTKPGPTWAKWTIQNVFTTIPFLKICLMVMVPKSNSRSEERVKLMWPQILMAHIQFRFATKSNSNLEERRETALTPTRTQWKTPPRNTGKNIKRLVVLQTRLKQLNTSIMTVFMNKLAQDKVAQDKVVQEVNKTENKRDVQGERETIQAGTASLSTRTRLIGAQATRTNNTRATQMQQRPNLATENHLRVLTRLS